MAAMRDRIQEGFGNLPCASADGVLQLSQGEGAERLRTFAWLAASFDKPRRIASVS
jgi:hypothetical protein